MSLPDLNSFIVRDANLTTRVEASEPVCEEKVVDLINFAARSQPQYLGNKEGRNTGPSAPPSSYTLYLISQKSFTWSLYTVKIQAH